MTADRCMEGREWKRREVAPREVDVHARWKPEREAEDQTKKTEKMKKKKKTRRRRRRRRKRRSRRRRRRRRRDEDRAVDQKQLE